MKNVYSAVRTGSLYKIYVSSLKRYFPLSNTCPIGQHSVTCYVFSDSRFIRTGKCRSEILGVHFWVWLFAWYCSSGVRKCSRSLHRRQAARINTANRHATVAANVSCSQQYSDTAIRKICARYYIRFACDTLPLQIYDNAAEYLPYS